jgi:hypothetical protein
VKAHRERINEKKTEYDRRIQKGKEDWRLVQDPENSV